MTFLRGVVVVLALLLGGGLAALFAPAAWLAPQLFERTAGAALLTHVQGSLSRGSGVLRVPVLGVTEPVQWRIALPWTVVFALGGGEVRVSPAQTMHVVTPVTVALRHANASATVTAQPDVQLTQWFTSARVVGTMTAPQLRLSLPATMAQFENIKISLDPAGVLTGSATGDATGNLSGRLDSLNPTRGAATLTLGLTGRNPPFEAGARRVMTANANNQLTYVTRFR